MSRIKRFFSILMAAMMTIILAVPAFAATTETSNLTITVEGGADSAQYVAYRLFDLTTSSGSTSGGTAITNYAYTLGDKYRSVLKAATKKDQDGDIVLYVEGLTQSSDVQTFANDVYTRIQNAKLEPDATTADGENVFKNVPQGYYLIAESQSAGVGDSFSLVMLKTAGLSSVKVSTKEDVPTLEKKVKADNDNYKITGAWASGVQDAADYDIGDDVPFQLTGSLPTTIKNYSSYQYIFHDTLAAGFTYNNDVQFYYVQDGVWSDITDYTYIYNEKEYKAFTTTVTNKDDGSTSLTFNCNAIRGLVSNAKEGDKIVVRYTAKLTGENVVMGSAGNTNEAWLEYSNNPYNSNTTTETVHDKVTVFTYQVIVNKIRDDEEKTPLTGAEFTLKKQNGSNWETVGTGIKSTDGTVFTFKGLDAGTYRLEETTVPTGYHKADDLTFKIEAKYDITSETPALTQLIAKDSSGNQISGSDTATFAVDLTKGSLTTYIINETGTLLPETGGIGTKIFTVAGIALMLTAGVLLVTRRKMNK